MHPDARPRDAKVADIAEARRARAPEPQADGPLAERRQLTVLFCDLVDSTALAGRLDPEDYRELVLAYQKAAGEIVARYEGHVAQYLGDGLLVYFGYPVAHEDDAERAVRCGYDIVNALKRLDLPGPEAGGLRGRAGIHTGPVVVGQMGGAGRQETLAMGDTTNLAARLQTAAEADTVVVSDATLKLVRGLVISKDLGPLALKGMAQPVGAHQIVQPSGVRTRLEAAERLTPFVGREVELALLGDCWEQAQSGQGQAVLISAEPGLGKSRLLLMSHARMRDSAHSWLECRCNPMSRNSAYQPIIELLHQAMKLKEADGAEVRLQRLEQALDAIGLDRTEAVPLLAPFLNLSLPRRYDPSPYGTELKRRKTMDTLIAWVLALAAHQPLVLVLEDLHWADPSSLDLLGRLLEQIPAATVLVLMTARPEFQPNWAAKGHLTAVNLKPLAGRHMASIVHSVAGNKALPPAVAQKILESAGGVPLFVEEITKQLLESGQLAEEQGQFRFTGAVGQLAIPTTLQDSLMARLDRQQEAKAIAQVCAVIGREIPYALLARVAQDDEAQLQAQLARLCRAELLYQRGSPPDAVYVFKHALIRDAAYQSLLRSTRQQLHGRISEALERHFPARARAEPAVLAEHCEKAGRIACAVKYFRLAGEAAAARTAVAEAIAFFDKALALLPLLPEELQRNRLELALLAAQIPWLGSARGYAHPGVQAALARGRELLEHADNPVTKTIVLGYSHIAHHFAAQFDQAVRCAEATAELGRQSRLPPLELSGHGSAALSYFSMARITDSLARSAQALQLATELETDRAWSRLSGVDGKANALMYRAWATWFAGFPDQALSLAREAQARTDALGVPMASCVTASFALPLVLRMRRDWQAMREHCESAAVLCEHYGNTDGQLYVASSLGIALGMLGEVDRGLAMLRKSVHALQATGRVVGVALEYIHECWICLKANRLVEARTAVEYASTIWQRTHEAITAPALEHVQGALLLAEGGGNKDSQRTAEACFRKSLEIARAQQARSLELRAATSLARLWQTQGRGDEARALLEPIYQWFTEGFDTADLQDAGAVLR